MRYSEFKGKVKTLPVFSTSMLGAMTNQVETLKVQLSSWKKKGLVSSLRKGLYVLSPEERRVEPTAFYLANQIYLPSYVSVESALAYHGLVPEFVAQTTSVTVRNTRRFENEFGVFTYQHIIREGFGGFESIQESQNLSVLVATPEKALVDFFYLNLSQFRLSEKSVFTGSYRFQNYERLNPAKLRAHAKKFGTKKLLSLVELFIKESL